MTITTEYAPVQYTGNGVTTAFSFPYVFYDNTDLIVTLTVTATGVSTTQILGTDYTLSGGSGSSGTVTMTTAPASTVTLTIERSVPYKQNSDFEENTAFPAETLERALDKAVVMTQQVKASQTRSILSPIGTSLTSNVISGTIDSTTRLLGITTSGPSTVSLSSLSLSGLDVVTTGLVSGDFLKYNGTEWVNVSSAPLVLDSIKTSGSSGVAIKNSGGTTAMTVGPANTTNVAIVGGLTLGTDLAVTEGGTGASSMTAYAVICGGTTSTAALQSVASVGTSGQVLKSNGAGALPTFGNVITLGTPQSTTSGTSIDFTSIPSGTKIIKISFIGVSHNSTSNLLLQIGDAGGVETSGYVSTVSTGASATGSTAGFLLTFDTASTRTYSGTITLSLADSSNNTWTAEGGIGSDSARVENTAGYKSLSAELDRIRLTTVGGTATFYAGKINILYL